MKYKNLAKRNSGKTITFCFIFLFFAGFLFAALNSFSLSIYEAAPKKNSIHTPPLSLIGVIISKETSSSVAILRNEETGKTILLTPGQKIFDLKLIQVFEDRITLKKDKKTYQIFLGRVHHFSADSKNLMNRRNSHETKRGNESQKNNQLITHPIKREFVRSNLKKRIMREWSLIINKTKFVPHQIDGEISGFKITSLPERSILSEIGILKNDVIKEINGTELNSLETLFSLFQKLKDESRIDIYIERKGRSFHKVYILK